MFSLVLLFTVLVPLVVSKTYYGGHKVLRITPSEPKHVEYLLELHHEGTELDFWSHPSHQLDRPVDVRVAPEQQEYFEAFLLEKGMSYTEMIPDVQEMIDHEKSIVSNQMIVVRHITKAFSY
eukprot:TRINITY_DN15249_c0_g1_i1.p1 TRINITY_DN15249_c0_g1~~TRINITY_DN15249_c0_g1_i1.p1  ORF type:complete len:122 (+),score=15.66 TRINITY_DN15249_c0_g1_i1:111-476(+)